MTASGIGVEITAVPDLAWICNRIRAVVAAGASLLESAQAMRAGETVWSSRPKLLY
jgi:hypothetical protein